VDINITRDDILKAAQDARLELSPEETDSLETTINKTIKSASFLHDDSFGDPEPAYYPLKQENIIREDVPAASLPPEKALSNAPETEGAYILVPKIVE